MQFERVHSNELLNSIVHENTFKDAKGQGVNNELKKLY